MNKIIVITSRFLQKPMWTHGFARVKDVIDCDTFLQRAAMLALQLLY